VGEFKSFVAEAFGRKGWKTPVLRDVSPSKGATELTIDPS
jgi:hypothetical protein